MRNTEQLVVKIARFARVDNHGRSSSSTRAGCYALDYICSCNHDGLTASRYCAAAGARCARRRVCEARRGVCLRSERSRHEATCGPTPAGEEPPEPRLRRKPLRPSPPSLDLLPDEEARRMQHCCCLERAGERPTDASAGETQRCGDRSRSDAAGACKGYKFVSTIRYNEISCNRLYYL